jgi:hypothetical protein
MHTMTMRIKLQWTAMVIFLKTYHHGEIRTHDLLFSVARRRPIKLVLKALKTFYTIALTYVACGTFFSEHVGPNSLWKLIIVGQ